MTERIHVHTDVHTGRPMVNLGFTSERHPLGVHMCYVYKDDEERRDVVAKFINAGVEEGEFVGYFADIHGEVDAYLDDMGIKIPSEAKDRKSLFAHAQDVYCPDNVFDPDRMLANLVNLYSRCQTEKIDRSRVSGEMSWALNDVPGAERLTEYEARVNIVLKEHPVTAICQYDARKFDGDRIFDILRVHPHMVVRGQVVHNPYFIPPEEFLKELRLGTG